MTKLRKRIVQVIPHFYPAVAFGGPAVAVYELVRRLSQKNFTIDVFTTDVFNKTRRMKNDEKIQKNSAFEIFYFKNINNYLAYSHNGYFSPNFYFVLLKNIQKYSLIHIHEIFSIQNIFALKLARHFNIPVVITSHGSLTSVDAREKILMKSLFLRVVRKLLLNADAWIALTESEKNDYLQYGIKKEKITIIPFGANNISAVSYNTRKFFREKYHIKNTDNVILFLGRFHKIKRIDLIIRSFKLARKNDSSLYLLLVGPDGGEKTRMKEMAQKYLPKSSFVFLDEVDNKEKAVVFGISNLFILTSASEGLSGSLLEAGSVGLPIIVTKSCNFPLVSIYNAGYVVDENPSNIADKINKIFSSKKNIVALGNNSKKMVEENFSWDHTIELTEMVYKKAIEGTI